VRTHLQKLQQDLRWSGAVVRQPDQPRVRVTANIAATNEGDTERFVAVFVEDAYLYDWGRRVPRPRWHPCLETDNIGKHRHFDVAGFEKSDDPERYILTVKVTGNGFNGRMQGRPLRRQFAPLPSALAALVS
jgi:hypothetical protein